MKIPKTFIPNNEKILEERMQYLLKKPEPEFEPTELLKINGELYVVLTHPNKVNIKMERNLSDYYFSDRFKIIELLKYEQFQKTLKINKK